jgi:hypothetical protein
LRTKIPKPGRIIGMTDRATFDRIGAFMPTTYNDQFYVIDPYAPPPVGTTLVAQRFDLVDQNDDGDVDRFNGDSIDGSDIRSSYPGDTVTSRCPTARRSPIPASPSTSPMGARCSPRRMAAFCKPGRLPGSQRRVRTGRARCQRATAAISGRPA